jgi:hypothetical protein
MTAKRTNGMLIATTPTTVSMDMVLLLVLEEKDYGAIAAQRFDLGQTARSPG